MANSNTLEPWNHLDGKVVLVTGASSGLGREFCLDLAKAGCKIIAAARRVDLLKYLCDEINKLFVPLSTSTMVNSSLSSGSLAVPIELDVTADAATIEASIQKAWDAFGHIDVLVNNAGLRGKASSSLDLPVEDWNTAVRTNLTGAWLVSKYVGMHMREAGRGGSIINISSVAGLNRPQMRGGVAYSSSKVGMNSMTKMMALELGEHCIRVNAIAPGIFPSEITEGLLKNSWMKNFASRTIPLKTFGTTDPALTSLVRFLIHDSSSYITDGKAVWVTEASLGFSSEFCLHLAKAGCKIVVVTSWLDLLKYLCDGINRLYLSSSTPMVNSSSSSSLGSLAPPIELDVTVDATYERLGTHLGNIDASVNNVGIRGL